MAAVVGGTVTIGPGRRVTLAELFAVATRQSSLHWMGPAVVVGATSSAAAAAEDAEMAEIAASMEALKVMVDDDDNKRSKDDFGLTLEEVRAFLTVLAFQVVTAHHDPSSMTMAQTLVRTVGGCSSSEFNAATTVSRSAAIALARGVWTSTPTTPNNNSDDDMSPDNNNKERTMMSMIDRSLWTSELALTVYRATQLAQCALPVAALTVDSTGNAPLLLQGCYSEETFDVKRPHRSMIRAAAILRAILHESRFTSVATTAKEDDATDSNNPRALQAMRDIPQYHGPTAEQIAMMASQLELEMNSQQLFDTTTAMDDANVAASSSNTMDSTLLETIAQSALTAVSIQWNKSCDRQGIKCEDNNNNGITPSLSTTTTLLKARVAAWEESLSREAATAVQRVLVAAPNAAAAPVVVVAARGDNSATTTTATTATTADDTDEFAGMTPAQVTKILRIRAEKEAKAAAKRQAKTVKGAALFGTGTHALCQILEKGFLVDDNKSGVTVLFLPRAAAMSLPSEQKESDTSSMSEPSLVQQWQAAIETLLSGGVQRKPKIPKGTRDYLPDQMMIRQQAFDIIRRVFAAHGAVEIDTPVFELKETLTGKYGEDSKLIYDLADQGGELLALRYDLTVPFARFLALNNVGNIKRYHIGKVYRRDQPALKRGRYREFYQCDFDIAGVYGRMIPDSECLCVACDILDALPIGDFAIKVNHRCLLDAILDLCGVPADKFRSICSAVDKLDKEPWSEVKREMVEDKGLQEDVADKIGEFVLNKGPPFELYRELVDAKRFGDHKIANQAMEDLRILFEYLEAFDKLKFVSFDLSLARGLDYYTGVIYEAVCISGESQVGSIGGGGRYDNLVSMFQGAGKQTPCVGVSIGIERVFTLMEARLREEKGGTLKLRNVNVLVASAGVGMMKEKMKIARLLWDANISAEFSQQEKAKLSKEVVDALERDIPFMIVIGENELAENKCQVKDIKAETAELVLISDLVAYLRMKGVVPVGCEFAAEELKKQNDSC